MLSIRRVSVRVAIALFAFVLLTGARMRPVRPYVEPPVRVAPADAHSYANGSQVAVRHLALDLSADFERLQLRGSATLDIENLTGARELVLDSRGLRIIRVTLDGGVPTTYSLGRTDPILGEALRIVINPSTRKVRVEYDTGATASGLHWMSAVQGGSTSGDGQGAPFLYTQNEAIDARSWIPVHDSPQLRMTWEATIRVPPALMAVMSGDGNPREKREDGVYRFSMAQPVPAYLVGLAVADLEFRELDARSGVYAQPYIAEVAARELSVVPAMMSAAESIAGPYRWGRYDVLIMPPAYHIGGMEHARLSFVSPSFISGDGTLVALIAHELAHSWSGNLVTTANWNDIWLNEGLTVWLERRIMERVLGRDFSEMLAADGWANLFAYVEATGQGSPGTSLHFDSRGRYPNDGFSTIAYEKGYSFMRTLEEGAGREALDRFMRGYFSRFAFQWMDADGFLALVREGLVAGNPALETSLMLDAWIYGRGLPSNARPVISARYVAVEDELRKFETNFSLVNFRTADWGPLEFIHFLRAVSGLTMADYIAEFRGMFGFDSTQNLSLLYRWSLRVVDNRYAPSWPAVERYLMSASSRGGLYAIYSEMLRVGERTRAEAIYGRARERYHPYTQYGLDQLLYGSSGRSSGASSGELPSTKH